jgi:hypothetical protein
MARATDAQVQQFVNERVRPRAEQIRALLNAMEDDISAIGDVYAHLTDNPTWEDTRTDAPPYMLSANDVLAYNTFLSDMVTAMNSSAQLSATMKACVSPVGA